MSVVEHGLSAAAMAVWTYEGTSPSCNVRQVSPQGFCVASLRNLILRAAMRSVRLRNLFDGGTKWADHRKEIALSLVVLVEGANYIGDIKPSTVVDAITARIGGWSDDIVVPEADPQT